MFGPERTEKAGWSCNLNMEDLLSAVWRAVLRVGPKALREVIICVNRSVSGNNIKIGCRNSDWLHGGVQCQAVVNTIMNLCVP